MDERRDLPAFTRDVGRVAAGLALLLLAGCVAPTFLPSDSDGRGEAAFPLRSLPLVQLPVREATEPSIATLRGGVVAVVAGAGRSLVGPWSTGGYLWVSDDHAQTFRLVLDPPSAPEGPCACDNDITTDGKTIYATTMYTGVNPLFNANVIASTDRGRTWEVRSPAAGREQPLDRPWLVASETGQLVLAYLVQRTYTEPIQPKANDFYLQLSDDGGRAWSEARLISHRSQTPADLYRPVILDSGRIIVPIGMYRPGEGFRDETLTAHISDDGGRTFRVVNVTQSFPHYAAFDASMDEQGGLVVATWTAPVGDGTVRLHVSTSDDEGDTWSAPIVIPHEGTALQPWLDVGPHGTAAIVFHGSNATGDPLKMGKDAEWTVQVVLFDPRDPSHAAAAQVSPEPVYRGVLCNRSARCPEESFLVPMREFQAVAWSPEGDLYVAYMDASDAEGERGRGPILVRRYTTP